MITIKVAGLLFVVMLLAVSATSLGESGSQITVMTGTTPGVSINTTNSSFGLTYSYLLVGVVMHDSDLSNRNVSILFGANLDQQTWHVSRTGSTIYYNSSFRMSPTSVTPLGALVSGTNISAKDLGPFLKDVTPSVNFTVVINESSGANPDLTACNVSNPLESSVFGGLNLSTIEINNYFTISQIPRVPIAGFSQFSYRIELLQNLNAVINGKSPGFLNFNGHSHALEHLNGFAMSLSHRLSNSGGLFWWPDNYTLNGVEMNLVTYFLVNGGNLYLGFQYTGNSTGTTIVQDPYISVLNETIKGVKIVNQVLKESYDLILENAELLSTGSVIGGILVGVAYTAYRKKRF